MPEPVTPENVTVGYLCTGSRMQPDSIRGHEGGGRSLKGDIPIGLLAYRSQKMLLDLASRLRKCCELRYFDVPGVGIINVRRRYESLHVRLISARIGSPTHHFCLTGVVSQSVYSELPDPKPREMKNLPCLN